MTAKDIKTNNASADTAENRSRGLSGLPKSGRVKLLLAGACVGAVLTAFGGQVLTPEASAQAPRLLAPNAQTTDAVSIPDLVERVSPAVVSVLVEREVEQPRGGDPFQEFFRFRFGDRFEEGDPRGRNREEQEPESRRMSAQGSGFFVDGQGHIVTNNHVVEGSEEIRIRLANGDELEAELVGADPLTDLAVVKVKHPKGQNFVDFADDVNLRVGETVVAVGNPFGLGGTVTSGIVSAIGGESRQGQFLDYIQIDAPINRGNSGGPTFDLQGRVVGVNTAIYSPNGGSVGIGFAIPARVAKVTIDQLIKNGSVTRGWLGVSLRELDTTFAAAMGRDSTNGAFVEDVLDGTPAQKAGLVAGDLILDINGREIKDTFDLSRTVSSYPPGESIKVTFIRDGKERTLNVKLGERGAEEQMASNEPAANENTDELEAQLGLRVAAIDARMRTEYRLDEDIDGVVVTDVSRGGAAAEAGLRAGMVILQIDGAPVRDAAALRTKVSAAVKDGKDAVLLRLQIGENKRFAALPIRGES